MRPASVDEPQSSPTCSPVECAELAPSDIVVPEPACNLAACADARVDLEPGSADIDVAWDGVFWSLTERGCYEPETFEGGAPMLARVCFGAPGADLLEVSGFRCEDVPFAYGTSLVELALE